MTKILLLLLLCTQTTDARECKLPQPWESLCGILKNRVAQTSSKMKLTEKEAAQFEQFLSTPQLPFRHLTDLQKTLPKTTVELIRGIFSRGVSFEEAESIAHYLEKVVESCGFKNPNAFDNNTSHIIGREWHEIDYTGEGMTWQKQKRAYARHGITNFKTLKNIQKFFAVESRLGYFHKIYKPQGCKIFKPK